MEDHLPALDGIRGLGILWVMAFHFSDFLQPGTLSERALFLVAKAGWIGLEVFFVLSGYLITGILYDTKNTEHFFGTFYARRFLRVVPLYYGIILIFVAVLTQISPLDGGESRAFLDDLGWYWSFLVNGLIIVRKRWNAAPYNTSHFWSLSLEEQYYLMWPAVVFFCSRRRLLTITAVAFVASALLRVGMRMSGASGLLVFVFTPARLDALAVGSFVALAARGPRGFVPLLRAAPPVAAASGAILLGTLLFRGKLVPADILVQLLGLPAMACLSAVLLMIIVTDPRGPVARWFERPSLLFFGKYSYGIYVIHFPMVLVLSRWNLSMGNLFSLTHSQISAQLLFYAIAGAASVIPAWLSWHLYEKRFLKLKNRYFPLVPAFVEPPPPAAERTSEISSNATAS